jgi:penicillin-binding protein 2
MPHLKAVNTTRQVKESKRDNAMFIAFAPYENPEIVIAVAIENVAEGGGGTNAGPVARQIMDQYFGDREIISKDPRKHPHHSRDFNQKIKNTAGNP